MRQLNLTVIESLLPGRITLQPEKIEVTDLKDALVLAGFQPGDEVVIVLRKDWEKLRAKFGEAVTVRTVIPRVPSN